MYGKRVNAVIWNDNNNSARGFDKRSRFVASYILDEGFETFNDCLKAVIDRNNWAYVCFCNNWYALNAQSYDQLVIVTKEHVYIKEDFDKIVRYPADHAITDDLYPHNIGPVWWADGVYQDFLRIDPDLLVLQPSGHPYNDILTVSNTVVALGIPFFSTDICIRTDNYVKHVFSHYYNDRSMEYKYDTIRELRNQGIEYWNPFSGNTAIDEKDRNRQKREREKNIDMSEINEDREYMGKLKIMDMHDMIADAKANRTTTNRHNSYKRKY